MSTHDLRAVTGSPVFPLSLISLGYSACLLLIFDSCAPCIYA